MILHKHLNLWTHSDLQDWCRPDQETDSIGRLELYLYYDIIMIHRIYHASHISFLYPESSFVATWKLFTLPTVQNIFSSLWLVIRKPSSTINSCCGISMLWSGKPGFFHKSRSVITPLLWSFFFKDFYNLTWPANVSQFVLNRKINIP